MGITVGFGFLLLGTAVAIPVVLVILGLEVVERRIDRRARPEE